jgi:glycosyltransferase involved in cell wall biosynthesis
MVVNITSAPKGGGAELLVHELHKRYLNKNIDSRVIYLSGSSFHMGSNEEVIGVNPRNPVNVLRIRKQLRRFLKKSEPAIIVHAHLTWPFLYVALATIGLKNLKLVYTEHSTTNKRRRIPLFWLLERLIYRRYSKIICISKGVHDSLAGWVGPRLSSRLVTIQNGARIYQVSKRLPLKNRKPCLISVGSLSAKKNFSTAIQAISQLRDEVDTYVIVGEGSERKLLEQIIYQENLKSQVKLVGWSERIEEYLQRADIQLIPSLWEGFGLVAVEGMSTGLQVVASDVSGLREVLDPNNPAVTLVEDMESVDAWVKGLKVAIVNLSNEGPEKLAVAARTQAEKFTLEIMVERYLELYRSL